MFKYNLTNGNSDYIKGIPWQTWFTSVASIVFTISSVIFWETRNIVYDTKSNQIKVLERLIFMENQVKENTHNLNVIMTNIHNIEKLYERYIDNLQSIPTLRIALDGINVRLTTLENTQKNIDGRISTILQRLSYFHQVLNDKATKENNMNELQ